MKSLASMDTSAKYCWGRDSLTRLMFDMVMVF